MRKRMKRLLSGLVVLAISSCMVLNVNATTIEDAKKKAKELENQKGKTEAEKKSLTEQLNTILEKMQATRANMTKKEEEISAKEEELTQAKIDENDQYESMKKRIKFMYENGNVQFLEILLSSESITDFLNKAEYVSEISEYDRNMLVEFQQIVETVEEQQMH